MRSRVAVVKCDDYNPGLVAARVGEVLDRLGGMRRFVSKGQRVLLKPNMLSAHAPERGITTHPIFIEAIVDEVRQVGGKVLMGDSPAGAMKSIQRYWEATGFGELAEKLGIELINFESAEKEVREIGNHRFHVAKTLTDADVVINLPKFKTHGLTLYTGAVKNLLGVLPGFQKVRLHKLYPNPTSFSRMLVELYRAVAPQLNLMDGILGMGGNGPSTGDLRQTGLIIASTDGIALDAVASRLMGFRENEVDVVRIGGETGAGEARLEAIDILGESLDSIQLKDFHLPSNRLLRAVPESIGRLVGKLLWVRPYADPAKCTGCGICADNCPVDAIRTIGEVPIMDYKVCINCLCCNECCPEGAVVQKQSRLTRMFI